MPTPIISGAIKTTCRGFLFGQTVENVWGVHWGAGAPEMGDLEIINGIFQTAYVDIMAPLSDQLTLNEVTSRYLGSADGPEHTLAIIPGQTGGALSASSPGNVALCVSLRSAFAGRRLRGRKFFSGIPEANTASNTIDVALCDAVVEAINAALIGNLVSNGTPLAVISLVALAVTNIVTAVCVDNFVDSQRRRLTGRGR